MKLLGLIFTSLLLAAGWVAGEEVSAASAPAETAPASAARVEDKLVTVDNLPVSARKFLKTHCATLKPVNVFQMGANGGFEVRYEKGGKVEFTSSGAWCFVKFVDRNIPASLLKPEIATYLAEKRPGAAARELRLKNLGGYEIILSNGEKLEFDDKGKPRENPVSPAAAAEKQ